MRAGVVSLGVLVLLLASSPSLPIVWDEGNAILRAERIARWAQSWRQQGNADLNRQGERASPLSRRGIAAGWPYTTEVEGHPAFYGIVIAAGHSVGCRMLPPLIAWRLGPIVLFALAGGAMFYRMSRLYGQPAGWAATAALLLQPRLFAHAHFATCDGPLTACWILAWVSFSHAQPNREEGRETRHLTDRYRSLCSFACQAGLFGILLGMTMSTKATGWIAPIPFVFWAALYRDRRAVFTFAVGLATAMATFYLLNPPLWHEPIDGLATFFQLNTHRQLNVANLFLGRMYDLHHSLPWYNTLVWTAIAVPIGLLLLAGVGIISVFRQGLADRQGILLMFNWAILLVVRALPGTPPHDGIRLFLPAFAFLAPFIAIGSVGLAVKPWRTWSVVLIFLGSATSLFCYAPQWLSYYNLAIGGLPGATRAGMEPTYYWDSMDREVLDWLAENTAEGGKVFFGSGSVESLALMRSWGTLPVEFLPGVAGRYRWYVIQRRPSACMPPDQWLLQNARPVYKKYLPSCGPGPWHMNVPLLEIYRYEDYEAAVKATRSGP